MSANRYSECPKCTKTKLQIVTEVRALYGTIPLEEYENRLKAAKFVKDFPKTLREDWEIYIDGGKLVFSYSSECICGFTFNIKNRYEMK